MPVELNTANIELKYLNTIQWIEYDKNRLLSFLKEYVNTSLLCFRKRAWLKRSIESAKLNIKSNEGELITLSQALRSFEIKNLTEN